MGVRKGSIKNISSDQLQREIAQVFILYDLIFFIVLGLFVFFYYQITPFPKAFLGGVGFIGIVVANFLCLQSLDRLGDKYDWYIFSRYTYYGELANFNNINISKIAKRNNIFQIICFVIVWISVLFYAPDNIYFTEFKPNVISWLDQGKCDEINKYDKKIASFCSVMLEAKNNTKGSFVVLNKNLTAGATGCIYMLQSNNNGANVVTTKPQTCDISQNQTAFITIHPFIVFYDRGNGDGYAYSTEVSLTP